MRLGVSNLGGAEIKSSHQSREHLESAPTLSLAEMERLFAIFRDTGRKVKANITSILGSNALH